MKLTTSHNGVEGVPSISLTRPLQHYHQTTKQRRTRIKRVRRRSLHFYLTCPGFERMASVLRCHTQRILVLNGSSQASRLLRRERFDYDVRPSPVFLSFRNKPYSVARFFSQTHPHESNSNDVIARKLVLYSKPECCLCENLKEKLDVIMQSMDSPLSNIQLEVRNITTNADWETAYQYEIPVLSLVNEDGSERILPRLSPRLSPSLIQKKLVAAISSQDIGT